MLNKTFYRENSTMTQFRMILEPYLLHDVSPKYKASRAKILTQCTLSRLINIFQVVPSETLYKKLYSENSKVSQM